MGNRNQKKQDRLRRSFFLVIFPVILFTALAFTGKEVSRGMAIRGDARSYTVQWLSAFPTAEVVSGKSFGEKVSDIVFGKKQLTLAKPFSLVGEDPDNMWVLDQGMGVLLHVKDKACLLPPAVKKEHRVYPSLTGLCAFGKKRFLFTDSRLNKIFLVIPEEKGVKTLNDSLALQQPTGIAWSEKNGEIWVVETRAHRIAVLDSRGNLLRHVGHRGAGPGEFNYPTFIWIDKEGNVYIVDSMNFRVQILDAQGRFLSSFGRVGDASGYFARPKGIAVDSHGNIYVADALYNVVQIYDRQGNFLYYFGSQGHGRGQFWMPGGIYIDAQDRIYVADTYNARVQVFQLMEKKTE